MDESNLQRQGIHGSASGGRAKVASAAERIRDINPQAATHVLIIPKTTDIPRLADATNQHQALLGHLLLVAGQIARQLGVEEAFRLVINNGADAGQTVFRLHLHILASQTFAETSLGQEFS